MKKIAILGSTGSIGTQTLEVVRENKDIEVLGLAAGNNIKLLERQIREFHPKMAAVWSEERAKELRENVKDLNIKIVSGMEGLIELSVMEESEILVTAIVGMIGIRPTIEAIKAGKDIALANKETLVTAGHIIMPLAKEYQVAILPVDSEHSAIFQSLNGENKKEIHKILLTASGGPFRGWTRKQLEGVRVEDALKHPNWDMGAKITIDSATMMNKGLEFIEAKWLFDMPIDAIDIVVHRESVVHSAIAYQDNSVIAQLGVPDMRIPIQYALTCPRRLPSPVQELSLVDYGKLTFYAPDYDTFRCINVCKDAIAAGGLRPAAANGANEESVRLFLNGKIKFTDIAVLNRAAMEACPQVADYTLDDVLQADRAARDYVIEAVS